jgi:hypothetical protein
MFKKSSDWVVGIHNSHVGEPSFNFSPNCNCLNPCLAFFSVTEITTQVKKLKQSLFRPIQDLRVPGGWDSQISTQSAHEGGKVVSPTHRPPLFPQEIFLVHESVTGWVDPRAIERPEGLSMKTSSDNIATFKLVAQCINQMRHRAPRMSG